MARGISTFVFAVIGLLITTNYAITWERQRSREHPLHSVITISLIAAISVVVIDKYLRRLETRTTSYLRVKEDDSDEKKPEPAENYGHYEFPSTPTSVSRRRSFFIVLAGVIFRACIFVHVQNNTQCAFPGLEVVLLPVVFCIYDYIYVQNRWTPRAQDMYDMSNNTFEDLYQSLCHGRPRYILPTLMSSLGAYMSISHPQSSTYICSITNRVVPIPLLQVVATAIDVPIIISLYRLQTDTKSEQRKTRIYSIVNVCVALVLGICGLIYGLIYHELHHALVMDPAYIRSVIIDGIMWSILLVCFDQLIQECRALSLITLFFFCATFARLTLSSRLSRDIFPPHSISAISIGYLLFFLGFVLMMSFYKTSENSQFAARIPMWFYILLSIALVVVECIYMTAPRHVGFSPINYLMYEARISAQTWLTQASKSATLADAVNEYRRRYKRSPPPNFDKWFDYAMARNAYVIDDYDNMENALLPFWALKPAEIRRLTTIQDPDHDIVGLTIRRGHVDTGFVVSRESSWISNTSVMISNFSQWLPDMNIGFNVRDAPRVAVPWQEMENMKAKGIQIAEHNLNSHDSYSVKQNPPWPGFDHDSLALRSPILSPQVPLYRHIGAFSDVLAPTCPSKSMSRGGPLWSLGDHCQSCARVHSIGPYVSDWKLSTDMCHQPDMASQHSYLMSRVRAPTELVPQRTLTPVFSRQTLPGFNDILFPGPDSYLPSTQSISADVQAQHDSILFAEKHNTIFWRGSLDNTLSEDSGWQGQEYQRLSYHINNASGPSALLLPTSSGRLTYKSIAGSVLRSLISTSIHITTPQLNTSTTTTQSKELGTQPPEPISSWYKHKYLLALDANQSLVAPFSTPAPSFLQILASNSLPFRAQIFQRWYDDRLIPWLHYVPIDLRYTGLWATAAYFMGLGFTPDMEEGGLPRIKAGGFEGVMEGKVDQATFLARTGREWAEKTCRQEDAQVYAFRLLLEWGRLVDDRREMLGFALEGEEKEG